MRTVIAFFLMFLGFCGLVATFDSSDDITIGGRFGTALMAATFFFSGVALIAVPAYNRLVRSRNGCDMAVSDTDVLLQRRSDLLDNLIGVTERYSAHEVKVLTDIALHRSRAGTGSAESAMNDAQELFGPKVMAVTEAYPQLRADRTFTHLVEQLRETENSLAQSRQEYNRAVLAFNNQISSFPDMLVARVLGFTKRTFYEAPAERRQSPIVGRLA